MARSELGTGRELHLVAGGRQGRDDRGKTMTDHISPAGPWLRYRGHLDKFSDNMFLGATNAYTGEPGKSRNVLTGKSGVPVAENARDYRWKGIKWADHGAPRVRQMPDGDRPGRSSESLVSLP